MQLENKVAVVTGSSSGIGKAIALAFAGEGAAVVMDYRRHLEEAQDTVQQIQGAEGRAVAVHADVANPEYVRALVQTAVKQFGRLDIMVNNAGMEHRMPFLETTLEVWDEVIAVNLMGPWLGCQETANHRRGYDPPGRELVKSPGVLYGHAPAMAFVGPADSR